jgi:hypothetical protein
MSSVMRRRRGVMEKLLCAGGFMSQTTFPSLRNDAQVATDSGSIEMPAPLESASRCIPLCGLVQRRLCKDLHKRRNWIHIGSEQAGPRVAAILSVVETCRRLKIPVRDYLGSVLPGLGDFPAVPNRRADAHGMGEPKLTGKSEPPPPCVC